MSLDFAVLNCVPLNEDDWCSRAAATDIGDFVRFVSETRFGGDVASAWAYFRSEARFLEGKLERFRRRGAEVVERATSLDLRQALHQYQNVVLVAHWKGEGVLSNDIESAEKITESLQGSILNLNGNSGPPGATADILKTELNRFIHDVSNSELSRARQDRVNVSIERRDLLNGVQGLKPGNRLELWDRLLSIEQFAALFPPVFSGTLVLAICTSDYMADVLRRRHRDAMFFCGRDPVSAGQMLAKLDAAHALMVATNTSLWRGLLQAEEMIDIGAGKTMNKDMRLLEFVESHAVDMPQGGGHGESRSTAVDAAYEDLRLVQATNDKYFRIYWYMLILVFLATVTIALIFREEMGGLAVVLGTGGVVQAGLLQRLSSELKEKTRIDIVATLSRRLSAAQLQVVLKELLPALRK